MKIINYSCCVVVGWQHHELDDVEMVFPHHFRKLGIPSLIICQFVYIPHAHGDL